MRTQVSAESSALSAVLERLCYPIGVCQRLGDDPLPSAEHDTYAGWIITDSDEGGDKGSILADMLQARGKWHRWSPPR